MTSEKLGFRFTRIYTPAVLLFVFCNGLAGPFLMRNGDSSLLHMAAAFLTAVSVLVGCLAMIGLLRDVDEYIRTLVTQALLISIGLTLMLTSGYGYLMTYNAATPISLIFIVPVFVAFFAGVTGLHFARGNYK